MQGLYRVGLAKAKSWLAWDESACYSQGGVAWVNYLQQMALSISTSLGDFELAKKCFCR